MIEAAVVELTAVSGPTNACRAVGRPRATHYRRRGPLAAPPSRERRPQPRALEPAERTQVLEVLHSEPFIDAAPPTVFATLLDQGVYLASVSTMYRILHSRRSESGVASPATQPTSDRNSSPGVRT